MPVNRENHTKVSQFRLSQVIKDRLETIAAHYGTDRTDVIRMLITQEHERIARLGGRQKNSDKSHENHLTV